MTGLLPCNIMHKASNSVMDYLRLDLPETLMLFILHHLSHDASPDTICTKGYRLNLVQYNQQFIEQ